MRGLPSEKGGEAMREYVNGDCMDYLPKFSDNEFDLAIVDPPYGGGWSADANDTFNGAIVGRFGGQFARYFENDSRGGRFDRYRKGWKNGRDMGDEVPDERGYL